MKKLIGFFALLIVLSFAIWWSASHPPGFEPQQECILSMDLDIPFLVTEYQQRLGYTLIALPHDAGDIQCREAINPDKDTKIISYTISQAATLLYDNLRYAMEAPQNSDSQGSLANKPNRDEGLYRLDIGEYLSVFKT